MFGIWKNIASPARSSFGDSPSLMWTRASRLTSATPFLDSNPSAKLEILHYYWAWCCFHSLLVKTLGNYYNRPFSITPFSSSAFCICCFPPLQPSLDLLELHSTHIVSSNSVILMHTTNRTRLSSLPIRRHNKHGSRLIDNEISHRCRF